MELTVGRISGSEIKALIDLAREMLAANVELLDGVRDSIFAGQQKCFGRGMFGWLQPDEKSALRHSDAELFGQVTGKRR